jgi:hypothetical protein
MAHGLALPCSARVHMPHGGIAYATPCQAPWCAWRCSRCHRTALELAACCVDLWYWLAAVLRSGTCCYAMRLGEAWQADPGNAALELLFADGHRAHAPAAVAEACETRVHVNVCGQGRSNWLVAQCSCAAIGATVCACEFHCVLVMPEGL